MTPHDLQNYLAFQHRATASALPRLTVSRQSEAFPMVIHGYYKGQKNNHKIKELSLSHNGKGEKQKRRLQVHLQGVTKLISSPKFWENSYNFKTSGTITDLRAFLEFNEHYKDILKRALVSQVNVDRVTAAFPKPLIWKKVNVLGS